MAGPILSTWVRAPIARSTACSRGEGPTREARRGGVEVCRDRIIDIGASVLRVGAQNSAHRTRIPMRRRSVSVPRARASGPRPRVSVPRARASGPASRLFQYGATEEVAIEKVLDGARQTSLLSLDRGPRPRVARSIHTGSGD